MPRNVSQLYKEIRTFIESARSSAVRAVNITMVYTYFHIGRLIVEHEQKGAKRAEYATETLKNLSKQLVNEFGKGFSERNLENIRNFYITYSDKISQTLSAKSSLDRKTETLSRKSPVTFQLSWSHYVFLMKLPEAERKFYEIEAAKQNWSLRELERQFNSSLYERLALSRKKHKVKELSQKGHIIEKPHDLVKEPYVLEFLGLKEESEYSETDLETAIINKIEHFLLELGKGFLFVGRQQRFTFDEEHFFVDLVFYNRLLRCFVLIDLKIGKLKHQDIGQMQMYVNYYDRMIKSPDENSTVGIILCKEAKKAVVEFTLPKDNKQIFAKRYQLYLPSKEELIRQIEEAEAV
ncbi:MAG: hypothetical protein A2X34_10655 [Elusimicrobia bacterium GWC2_51_8]|nr:MAG: hypothetical protein A2X34_10655 [Elusimicrobia bacterium GWC2_51_8]